MAFIIWTIIGIGHGQNASISMPYTRYSVSDGLAQMQIRTLFVDQNGYVWIGTQGGISLFDGSIMRSYPNLGAISEGNILSIVRGSDGIYGSTLTENFFFNGVTVKTFDSQNGLQKQRVLFEDRNNIVWILSGVQILVHKNDTTSGIEFLYPKLKHIQIVNAWGDPSWDKCYLLDKENKFYTFNPVSGALGIDSTTFSSTDILGYTSNRSAFKSNVILYRVRNGVKDIYRLADDKLQHVASKARTGGLMKQLTGYAPLGYVDWNNGISTLFILRDSFYSPDFLPVFNDIRFEVEYKKDMYVGTDAGLIVVHFNGLENFSFVQCDYPWQVIPVNDSEVFIGCYRAGVYRLNNLGKLLQHYDFPESPIGRTGDAQILSNYLKHGNQLLFGSLKGFYYLEDQGKTLKHFNYPLPIEAFAFDKEKQDYIVGSDQVYWIDKTLSHKVDSLPVRNNLLAGAWINDLEVTHDQNLWIAAGGGIFRIENNKKSVKDYTNINKLLPCTGAITFVEDASDNLWSGGTCGLMKYDFHEDRFIQILPEIINKRVNQIAILPNERLICASNNDIYLLDISTALPQVITVFNAKNGLNINEPSENGISVSNDRYVWLPSVMGIQRLDLNLVNDTFDRPKLQLMFVNDHPVHIQEDYHEPILISGNSALLDVSVVDHSGRSWKYQFNLNGKEYSPWQSSQELLVSSVQHGTNKVRIRASWNITDPQSFIETEVVLNAHLPFLSRTRVQHMLMGLSILLGMLIIMAIILAQRSAQRISKLNSNLFRNRLRTIQAYLNPHFLFNTLTSIQDHILHQDAKAGNDMIVRLSRVFRKVLDVGKFEENDMPMTRLSEEIALIEDMVYLNNQQLTVPVNFELNIDGAVRKTDPLIPPMLIQPFVENAFKHAFTEGDGIKTVIVSINTNQNFLMIGIKDNGIGYSSSYKSTENSSMGTQLAHERMSILNELNIENNIEIHEIKPHGTLVEIKIKPLK